ncbi:MAG: SRPBCC family protein [Methylococcales bacterium]
MIKSILIVIALLILAILIYAATQPDSFRIERSITIKAPPETIFPLLNDFHHWQAWSPWEKIDPATKTVYSGAAGGVGAIYEWAGNNEVGQGRMEIIEASFPVKIVLKIDFIKPFEGHNIIEFTLLPQGDVTTVNQAMYGPSPYISKVMGLFFSMDKMVGQKYEQGLANLKALAESKGVNQ